MRQIYVTIAALFCSLAAVAQISASQPKHHNIKIHAYTAAPAKQTAQKAVEYPDIIFDQPEGTLVENWSQCGQGVKATFDYFTGSAIDGVPHNIVLGDNGEVYLQDPISSIETRAWIKGYKTEGDTVVVNLPQKLCYAETDDGDKFDCLAWRMKPVVLKGADGDSLTYQPDYANQVVKYVLRNDSLRLVAEKDMMLGLGSAEDGMFIGYGDSVNVTRKVKDPIYAPANPDAAESFILKHEVSAYEDGYTPVKVAFEGSDVYIGGLNSALPEAWAKGKIENDKVVFDGKTYMGMAKAGSRMVHTYLAPAGKEKVYVEIGGIKFPTDSLYFTDKVEFDYDAATKTLTTEGGMMVNQGSEFPNDMDIYFHCTLKPWADKPGVPKTPEIFDYWPYDEANGWGALEFYCYQEDVDGNYLNPDNLYYRIYMDEEPYVFTTDFHFELDEDIVDVPYMLDGLDWVVTGDERAVYFYRNDFTDIGVQAIYIDDNGKRYETPIVWYGEDDTENAVENISTGKAVKTISFTDLCGRKVKRPQRGLYIKTVTLSDGTTKTSKVILK